MGGISNPDTSVNGVTLMLQPANELAQMGVSCTGAIDRQQIVKHHQQA